MKLSAATQSATQAAILAAPGTSDGPEQQGSGGFGDLLAQFGDAAQGEVGTTVTPAGSSVTTSGGTPVSFASQLVSGDFHYAGCDVVPSLIEHLNETYGGENIEFHCRNIVEDELPDGDLCLIRQVLQHLSNREIERILNNVKKYK